MLLRKLQSPKDAIRYGAVCIVCGLVLMQVSISMGRSQTLLLHGSLNARDFLRGFLIGFAIVLEILGFVIVARARRQSGSASQ
jgi:hypothetical protein